MIEITGAKKRLLLKIIDNMLKLLYVVLSAVFLITFKKPYAINKILLIRIDHIGDAAMLTPVPKLIKEKYPGAKITVMIGSWSLDLFKNNPYVDKIICHDAPWWTSLRSNTETKTLLRYAVNDYISLLKNIRKERFDVGIDFRGDLRHIILFLLLSRIKCRLSYSRTGGESLLSQSVIYDKKLHETCKTIKLLNAIGIESRPVRPDIYITNDERTVIDKIFKINSIKENDIKIILSPGARLEIKRWPLNNFIELGKLLEKKYGAWIIFTGMSPEINKKDIPSYNKFVNLVDDLNLLQLTALFEKSNLLISNDSGATHIASSKDIPIIALFGPTDPDIYKPVSNNLSIVIAPEKRISRITVEKVLSDVDKIL